MKTTSDIDKKLKSSQIKYRPSKKISEIKSSSITRVDKSQPPRYDIRPMGNSIDTSGSGRLYSPLDAELKKAYQEGEKPVRRARRPARRLSAKSAPLVPTAPRDAATRSLNWIFSQIKEFLSSVDKVLCALILSLSVIGILAINSATATNGTHRFILVQGFAECLGIVMMLAVCAVDYRQFTKKYRYIIAFNAAILIFTYFFGQSVTETSNANWIDLGFIKIQPSEFAKLLFIYCFAVHLSVVRDRLNKITTVLTLFIHAGLIFGLVLLQRDLGSLTIFLMIFIAMCFASGLSVWYFIAGGACAVCLSPFIWAKLSLYQRNRILLCFDNSIDPNGVGIRYQQLRSQTAIGNGGITGTGYLKGTVTQAASGKLPAKHTDMIFSTICEEFGLIGAVIVLLLMAALILRIIYIAMNCKNRVGSLICVGIAAMLMIQVIENVGMCLEVMPVIGITFPFLSYGGSSALSTFIAMGMVLSVSAHEEKTFFD